ncbi:MAG TPA: VCBS repeat-containing protein [Candidatus Paceibacterota bacterium]|nr:VCBS repeat-containing protein [Verrucomicrobiota bacterium]HRY47965.1 VCBS repeat-containing protein [Candidatus Paceibacterota bacterium]HSA00663.1 VCBS repeat-containing protein [Candidatus Paceibacterota bacterium]
MKNTIVTWLLVALGSALGLNAGSPGEGQSEMAQSRSLAPAQVSLKFTHFTIANPLPGKEWGTAGIPLADLDGDGDLDAALSRRDAPGFWWYERRSDEMWVQHLISNSADIPQALGATALDVDNDGRTDLVFSHAWFRNPGTLRAKPNSAWTAHPFPGNGHDLLATDLNGDKRQDIVVFDGNILVWYNPAAAMASNVVTRHVGHHGGVTPLGVGDLDGDGDNDLVVAGQWFANPGQGIGDWISHAWPHLLIPNASYGTSIRSWVVDLDADGDQDIVYSDCDTGMSHVYWVRNEGKGANWTRFPLPDPPTSPGSVPGTGSFHSLGVADFDRDGDLDIFGGEQEDPDTYMSGQGKLPMKPKGLKERGVIWLQSGGHPPMFVPRVIQEDNPGWHDACLGDVDGDGDIDIVSKIWNKDGPTYHADYWRNDTVPLKSTAQHRELGFGCTD